ncbi:MAG: metallophosphoesterase [Anaerolineaceae bacterium]|nr:metallophosphoesterase [Anaerolineaceae bacterium]
MKRKNFITTELTVNTGKLREPIRTAVLSDLHNTEYGIGNFDLVEAVRVSQPDIITLVGDLMTFGNPNYSVASTLCRQLVKIAPVYFVCGNHEYEMVTFFNCCICKDLKEMGVHVLHNEKETVEINGNAIDIIGIACGPSFYSRFVEAKVLPMLDGDNFKLVLVHDPGYFQKKFEKKYGKSLIGKNIHIK